MIEVFEREQVLVDSHFAAIAINKGVGQATALRTLATVGTAAVEGSAQVALSAIAHAQCAMHKYLEGNIGVRGDVANLLERQLACQYHLREAGIGKELHLLRRAVVTLCAGVQGDRR